MLTSSPGMQKIRSEEMGFEHAQRDTLEIICKGI